MINFFSRKKFRTGPITARRKMIEDEYRSNTFLKDFSYSGKDADFLKFSETMVEHAVGYMSIPMGLGGPLKIDDHRYMIPMATEEPSVIAAISFVGTLTALSGGINTQAKRPVMTSQIFLEDRKNLGDKGISLIQSVEDDLKEIINPLLKRMNQRGGGWQGMDVRRIENLQNFAINLKIDVCDAMGANLLNSIAEKAGTLLEKVTGGRVLMGVLSNRAIDRTATATLCMPAKILSHAGFDGHETARRIVTAAAIAREDTDRAVTHNKGIMNGITSLALATGNDTRAVEAAVHAYACRNGHYQGLSEFHFDGTNLHGHLDLPLPFATIGGAVDIHPTARWALNILGNPDAIRLSRIAVALGLAQNLAALRALVNEGIQKGHMSLHNKRKILKAEGTTRHVRKP